jgi:hypothetical protein
MKAFFRFTLVALLVLAFVSTPFTNLVVSVRAASAPCINNTNGTGGYTLNLCITAPADGATFNSDGVVAATVTTVSGPVPAVAKMIFYIDGAYVITDFYPPFTFTLPTNHFLDGLHTLSVEAVMKVDGFLTPNRANIAITFATGTTTLPTVTNTFTPRTGTSPTAGQPFVVAAAGDAAGGEPRAGQVASLITTMTPNLFLYAGDVYEKGTYTEFKNWYDPMGFFGQFRDITDPTPGNHDYGVDQNTDPGYQMYWNSTQDYYSFNAGGWHFISLNSYSQVIAVGPTSPQYLWLQNDLNNNTRPCTLVFYHHPYLSDGQEGGRPILVDIWKLLAQHQVTIVVNGHDHEYQRWYPLDGNSNPSPIGITEFVIGTGGHSLQTLNPLPLDPRVAFASDKNPDAYGALKLALSANSATFTYIGVNGPLDSGTITCKGNAVLHNIFLPLIFR